MDATELIEEAEMLSAVASAAPWRCEHGRGRFEIKSGAVSLVGVLYEQDRDFIVGARTMVPELAAALRASEERARKAEDERDEIAAGLRSSSNLNFAMRQERDALAAANLAANKRIVELEHERDAALLAAQGARRTAFNAEQKAKALDAVQRDTIARLEAQVKELRAELARLTTPRPIVEAPRDGTWVLLPFSTSKWDACRGPSPQYVTARWFAAAWADPNGALLTEPSHYLPLPDVKP